MDPTEPPPTTLLFPPASAADEYGRVAIGGDLAPGTILAAYRGFRVAEISVDGRTAARTTSRSSRPAWCVESAASAALAIRPAGPSRPCQ